ncbi:phosphate transporter [Candidatus Rickettsiella viridis]|uniref:Phosphate transporter n=1 Tax=Candidatus Rickettsiella viridis TaxID=676208 RepID=A0A2Z5UUM4_9COXI|nr:hypothetical protein [Candidatus Rickettsiella viridis]BBB14691.1 phosphate transporter [Candidatus Rickettsiella viridis]
MRVRKKYLEKISLFSHSIQAGFFSIIFTFTSNIGGIRIIFERGLHAILFPIAITPDAIASLIALLSFGKAKNKNLGKTFDLIYVPTKAALVFTAVFAGLSVTIVNSLFLTVISSGIIYHTGLGLYNAYQWWKTPENSASHLKLKNLYKNNTINNGISSLIGIIILTGVITTLIFNPLLSAPILAIAGIGTAVMLMLTTTYGVYRHFKQPTIPRPLSLIDSTTPLLANTTESAIPELTGYYYRKFRSEKLSGDNFEEDRAYLLTEIENKKADLDSQIAHSRNKRREFFWPEELKRQAKRAFLQDIFEKLSEFSPKLNNTEFINAINSILSDVQAEAFQSFFRAKSDVGDIVDAIKAFVNLYKDISCELPSKDLHPNNSY